MTAVPCTFAVWCTESVCGHASNANGKYGRRAAVCTRGGHGPVTCLARTCNANTPTPHAPRASILGARMAVCTPLSNIRPLSHKYVHRGMVPPAPPAKTSPGRLSHHAWSIRKLAASISLRSHAKYASAAASWAKPSALNRETAASSSSGKLPTAVRTLSSDGCGSAPRRRRPSDWSMRAWKNWPTSSVESPSRAASCAADWPAGV